MSCKKPSFLWFSSWNLGEIQYLACGIYISQNNSRLGAPMSVRHFSGLTKFHSFRLCSGKRRHNVTNHPKVWMPCSLLLWFCCHFLCSSLSKSYDPFSDLATASLCPFSTGPLPASCAAPQLSHTQTMFQAAAPCDLDLDWASQMLGPLCPLTQEQPSKYKSRCLKAWNIPAFYRGNTGEREREKEKDSGNQIH